MRNDILDRVLDIGIGFSKEHNREKLLERILLAAIEITQCDMGTLYIQEDGCLIHQLSMLGPFFKNIHSAAGGSKTPAPIHLSSKHVCAQSAISRKIIHIPDIAKCSAYDFSDVKENDARYDCNTISLMSVPMEDDDGNLIGVVQLTNAKNEMGEVVPFSDENAHVVYSLGSQASICLVNMNYSEQIQHMLNSFIKVMSTAIDARTPYNANHTANMVRYALKFVQWLNAQDLEWKFNESTEKIFIMSIWLHDIGKLVTPRVIMDKQDRLGINYTHLMERLHKISLLTQLEWYKGKITEQEKEERLEKINQTMELVDKVNVPGYLTDQLEEQVQALRDLKYQEEDGSIHPWIEPQELEQLLIRSGTLTAEERKTMQEHVVMTEKMLGQMSLTGQYKNVLLWAARHHELLNGTGYPRGLKGEELCKEVRLLTILDIFEALTAVDRPYKPPQPVEKSLAILHDMADSGEVDKEILHLFELSRAWEREKE